MTVIMQAGYTLPGADYPLSHARICHSGNWLNGGTVVASTTDSDFFADGPANIFTYERWKPTALAATWEYDHGSAAECDYCFVAAHTLGTNGNSIQVQYHNGSGWAELSAVTAITANQDILFIFEPETRQRWRISITGGTVPEVGVVKFGKALQMPRPIYGGHSPLTLSKNVTQRFQMSETGEFLGMNKQRSSLQGTFSWRNVSESWILANWAAFQVAIEDEPFFFAQRPDTFQDAAICFTQELPVPVAQGVRDLHDISLQLVGRGYD